MISVLYVDDEAQLLEVGRLFLERSGEFHVDTTISAEAALKAIKIRQYDALVSDYQMPVMDGVELLKTIRNAGNNLPFILFTGRGREEVVIQALNEGADFYLQKGGSTSAQFTELGHKIRVAVDRRRSQAALLESGKKYSILFDKAPWAISLSRISDGTYVHVNKAWSDLFGFTETEARGKTPAELGISRDPEAQARLYAELLEVGSIKDREITTYRTKKTEHPVLLVTLEMLILGGEKFVYTSAIDITGQKQAGERLRYQSTLLSEVNDAIVASDAEYRLTAWNAAAERLYGWKAEEVLGQSGVDIVKTEWSDTDPDGMRRMIAETGRWQGEVIQQRRDGTQFFAEISSLALRNGKGEITGYVSVNRDITAKKKAEEALRESEELFRAFMDNSQFIAWMKDDEFRHVYLNRACGERFGVTLEECRGRTDRDMWPDDIAREFRKNDQEVLETGKSIEVFEHTRDPAGETTLWWNIKFPIRTPSGRTLIGGIGVDITERELIRQEMRENEKRYRDLFEINHAVMLVIDPVTGEIADANGEACRYYGYRREEITQMHIQDLLADNPEQIKEELDTTNVENGAVFHCRQRKKNGEIRIVDVFTAPVLLGDRYLLHTIVHDVTNQTRAEDALRQVNKKLNLLSSITRHDITNQLTALNTYLELSKASAANPVKVTTYMTRAAQAAYAIERQVAFTKDYQNLGMIDPVWQNIGECIAPALGMLPVQQVRVVPEVPPIEVFADPLLERVFYNLIDNALRYGGPKLSEIRIASRESEKGFLIIVEDNGTGIPAEDKTRLFTKGFGKNTGLGLFLSREILSITGISIDETGNYGKGARFEIAVPKESYRFTEPEYHSSSPAR
jgi:PAS domain S-box-containing protein